jgi:hypothetical protein
VAASERLSELRNSLTRLRRESAATAGEAQRIVNRGVQRLAEHQLGAVQEHFQTALDSIRAANGGSIPVIARRQAEMLQQTVRRVMVNARESLAIVAATRMELVDLMKKSSKKGGKTAKKAASKLSQLKAKAKKVVAKAKSNVKKAKTSAKKSVAKAKKQAKAATRKPVAKAKAATKKPVAKVKAVAKKASASVSKAAKTVKAKVSAAAAPVVSAMHSITPSPLSRAFLATSAGKKEAEKVAPVEPTPPAPVAPAPDSGAPPSSTPGM